jgi:hypothetical protein
VKARRLCQGGGLLLLLALELARPARASVMLALSLEDLTRKADLIELVVPTERQSRMDGDGKLIVTDVSLRVEQSLKGGGKPGQTLVATLLGGRIEQLALQVPGEASLPIGQRLLVFLQRAPKNGELHVVGMSQGVLTLSQQGGATMVLPGGSGAELMQRGSDGALHGAPDALLQPQPLGQLLDRIRSLVAAQAN